MKSRQQQVVDMIVRVQAFLAGHPAIEPSSYAVAKRVLEDTVRELREFAGAQLSGLTLSKAGLAKAGKAAKRLLDRHVRPIVTVAQDLVGEGVDVPVLTMPPSGLGFTALVTYADGLADTVTPCEPVFVQNGCPNDFIAQLRAARAELEAELGGRASERGKHIGATKGIEVTLRRARAAIKRIDALVRMAYAGNEPVLERWKSAKRVVAARVTAAEPATQPDITPEKLAA
jgi:hypothetical protein